MNYKLIFPILPINCVNWKHCFKNKNSLTRMPLVMHNVMKNCVCGNWVSENRVSEEPPDILFFTYLVGLGRVVVTILFWVILGRGLLWFFIWFVRWFPCCLGPLLLAKDVWGLAVVTVLKKFGVCPSSCWGWGFLSNMSLSMEFRDKM